MEKGAAGKARKAGLFHGRAALIFIPKMKHKLLVSLFFPALSALHSPGATQYLRFRLSNTKVLFFPPSFLFLLLLFNSSSVQESGKIN